MKDFTSLKFRFTENKNNNKENSSVKSKSDNGKKKVEGKIDRKIPAESDRCIIEISIWI